jgi:hypothetical protein
LAGEVNREERILFGGMARLGRGGFFRPTYSSSAELRDGKIHIWIDPSNLWQPKGMIERISKWPIVRSIFLWVACCCRCSGQSGL